jgi:hypothetical protein
MHSPKKGKPPALDDYDDRDNDILNLYRLTSLIPFICFSERALNPLPQPLEGI